LRDNLEEEEYRLEQMSGNFTLANYSPGLSAYAPADFLDAAETQPPEIALDVTSTGSSSPYSLLMTNIANRQLQEIKEKTVPTISHGSAWKKRVRDFMLRKNESLLEFLSKPLANHPTLNRADVFFRRFGMTNFSANHHSLREVHLDASGVSMIPQVEEELSKIGPSSSVKITEQVRWLYDEYRKAGEQLMKSESNLKMKIDSFDKIHQKTLGLLSLPVNEKSSPFEDAAIEYLEQVFKEQTIEEDYKEYVEAYRRFTAIKEMITTFRFTDVTDKEPLCCICLAEPVSYCLSPCGHTFCSSCVKRQMSNCYMCRSNIKDRIHIFFG
jgi:hypothetical protein